MACCCFWSSRIFSLMIIHWGIGHTVSLHLWAWMRKSVQMRLQILHPPTTLVYVQKRNKNFVRKSSEIVQRRKETTYCILTLHVRACCKYSFILAQFFDWHFVDVHREACSISWIWSSKLRCRCFRWASVSPLDSDEPSDSTLIGWSLCVHEPRLVFGSLKQVWQRS